MVWTWRFETAEGTEVQPAVQPEEFPTQGDAESWLGLNWRELLEGGADQVVLSEDEKKIYGPMSLHADSGSDSESDSEPEPAAESEAASDS